MNHKRQINFLFLPKGINLPYIKCLVYSNVFIVFKPANTQLLLFLFEKIKINEAINFNILGERKNVDNMSNSQVSHQIEF